MSDPITITTHTSWFSRLGSAFRGVATGIVIILTALGFLFWNEGRTVDGIRKNNEGSAAVVPVSPSWVDPANEGRLIYLTAPVQAKDMRQDSTIGIGSDALILARKVEYYQWHEARKQETRTKLGGGEETITTYSYDRQWSDVPQDSSGFQQAAEHQNPTPTLRNAEFRAERGTVGAFAIDDKVINRLTADQPLSLLPQQVEAAAKALSRPVIAAEGGLYIGDNPADPKIGDMRISYTTVPQATTISIVAAQTSAALQPYPTKSGSPILMVRTGTASADQMFAQDKARNKTLAWLFRGIGFVLVITGLKMLLGPLGVIGDVVPLMGSIIRMGTGFIATVVGLALGTVTIAVAWLFYRPILSIMLFAIIGGAVYSAIWWRNKRAPTPVVTGAA
ncbi:TMEM43 family protein [Sphingopyxis yananensis]|uniref:TMEM43 family protein n=1 Tax=Sphingopyxis yananensis TaxID=2886687 RepID=UPI001D109AD8|nr:TMEM43 family protein [Sphingopyxis yananensis]MCC2603088.1 TMEM43 family protein [Sphingopyxis yananensis]